MQSIHNNVHTFICLRQTISSAVASAGRKIENSKMFGPGKMPYYNLHFYFY